MQVYEPLSDTWLRVILTSAKFRNITLEELSQWHIVAWNARQMTLNATISAADRGGVHSTDLPEHLSGREKPDVGGHWQRQAVPQPVELWRWRACGNTLDADRSVQDGGQLLGCLAVAIYHRRHWKTPNAGLKMMKMKINPSRHH